MSDVILPGIAKHTDGLNIYLNTQFGISGRRVGSDLVIAAADVARGFAPRNYLRLHHQIPLNVDKDAEVAAQLYSQISDVVKQFQMPPPEPGGLQIPNNFGLLSEVAIATAQLAVQPEPYVTKDLTENIIPLLRDKFHARFVTGVTIDADRLQAHISFAKISLLAGLYDVGQAQKLVQDGKALAGILPSAFDPLSYLDALTRFSPLALTLPIRRLDCAWHFQAEAMWSLAAAPVNGLMAEFMMSISPLAADSHILGLLGLANMGEANVWRFMRIVVDGLNRLISYLTDPRNFLANSTGVVNFLRQVQAYSAVQLLFADLAAMNYSTVAHQRISFAFSALDKLANLRVELGESAKKDSDAFKALCSEAQRDELLRLLVAWCKTRAYDELATSLVGSQAFPLRSRCKSRIHA